MYLLPSANLACNGRYPALYGIFYRSLQVRHVYLFFKNEPNLELNKKKKKMKKGVGQEHTLYAHKLS